MGNLSNSIDRHTPGIPESVWQGLNPEVEATYTMIKNKIVLPNSRIPLIAKVGRHGAFPASEKRVIKEAHLSEAEEILGSGKVLRPSGELLLKRSLSDETVDKYGMVDTRSLVNHLFEDTSEALTLRLPSVLPGPHDIDGISVPVRSRGVFLGFATWVTNNDYVKYAFSIPNRVCFGDDESLPEVTIVEGLFDAVALSGIGVNTMALGDSQPNYFKMMMASKYDRVRLLFDNDLAGTLGCLKAFLILTQMLYKPVKDIILVSATNQSDPEDIINSSGNTDFPIVDFNTMVNRLDAWG
jgi:hypothetical protein